MENSFRFSRRSAGIENEERMLCIDELGIVMIEGQSHEVMPPVVHAVMHGNLLIGDFQDDHATD